MYLRAVAEGMSKISYAGYRFPPEVIHQAIWLYLRFTLSFRDVEDLLAERGIAVSYETVRRWVNHFGPMIAAHLRKRRPKPHATWHLDEVYLKIDGRMVYLWRAVDAEGEVLDVLVQSKRNKHAALKLMRKLLKKYAFAPERLVTDDLRSYAPAARDLGIEHLHERGRWRNIGVENSHQPTRRGSARCSASRARAPPEIPLSPRRRVQHFQRPTPSHVSSITPRAPRRGDDHVARGRRRRMKIRTPYSPLALFAWQRDDAIVRLPPIPARHYPARRGVVSSLYPQLP
jgi:putative transposase